MKTPIDGQNWFFVDESGDPTFYDGKGNLIVGQEEINTNVYLQAHRPGGEPCLSIVDYMNWAVYRAFTRGEVRYFRTVEDKVSLLVDMYDQSNYPKNWYNRKNRFDINKITPL